MTRLSIGCEPCEPIDRTHVRPSYTYITLIIFKLKLLQYHFIIAVAHHFNAAGLNWSGFFFLSSKRYCPVGSYLFYGHRVHRAKGHRRLSSQTMALQFYHKFRSNPSWSRRSVWIGPPKTTLWSNGLFRRALTTRDP